MGYRIRIMAMLAALGLTVAGVGGAAESASPEDIPVPTPAASLQADTQATAGDGETAGLPREQLAEAQQKLQEYVQGLMQSHGVAQPRPPMPPKRPAAKPKSVESKPVELKPATKPGEAKPAAAKPIETKPVEVKPAPTAKPVAAKTAEVKPAPAAKPVAAKAAEAKPVEAKK